MSALLKTDWNNFVGSNYQQYMSERKKLSNVSNEFPDIKMDNIDAIINALFEKVTCRPQCAKYEVQKKQKQNAKIPTFINQEMANDFRYEVNFIVDQNYTYTFTHLHKYTQNYTFNKNEHICIHCH